MAVSLGNAAVSNLADIEPTPIDEPSTTPSNTVTLNCTVCGNDFEHTVTKGRKPNKCPNCRPSKASRLTAQRGTANVEAAVSSLEMMYKGLAFTLSMIGAAGAASGLEESIPALSQHNRTYLQRDPALTKTINRMGTSTGRAGFFAAQLMYLGPVAALATVEIRDRFGSNDDVPTPGI